MVHIHIIDTLIMPLVKEGSLIYFLFQQFNALLGYCIVGASLIVLWLYFVHSC